MQDCAPDRSVTWLRLYISLILTPKSTYIFNELWWKTEASQTNVWPTATSIIGRNIWQMLAEDLASLEQRICSPILHCLAPEISLEQSIGLCYFIVCVCICFLHCYLVVAVGRCWIYSATAQEFLAELWTSFYCVVFPAAWKKQTFSTSSVVWFMSEWLFWEGSFN